MTFTNRFFSFIISICFLANTLPSTIEHVFGEKHEHESHVCDNDFCFQEAELNCAALEIAELKKNTLFPKPDFHIVFSASSLYIHYSSPFSIRTSQEVRLRGPPIVV